jgi:hypothetical protein
LYKQTKQQTSMATVRNPLTGRQINVHGRTFASLFGAPTKRGGGGGGGMVSDGGRKKKRVGGELMVDREQWMNGARCIARGASPRPPKRPTQRQHRMVSKSMWSSDSTVVKGAKRSLKGHYQSRPSPPMSATLFSVGSRERGNDGRIWQITSTKTGTKRWNKV